MALALEAHLRLDVHVSALVQGSWTVKGGV